MKHVMNLYYLEVLVEVVIVVDRVVVVDCVVDAVVVEAGGALPVSSAFTARSKRLLA